MSDETLRFWPGYWGRVAPEKPAYVLVKSDGSGAETVTYRELDERSNRIARVFRACGVAPGDFIAILGENHPRFLEICWAAQRSGLRYVPINWHLTPAEIEYIANDCGAKLLVASATFAPQLAELAPKLPGVKTRLAFGGDVPGFERLEPLAAAEPATPLEPEIDGGDMIYTSGSTGRPKGGKRATSGGHPGAPNPGYALFTMFGLDEHSVYLSPGAPLYHAAPLRFCMTMLRFGGTCVVLDRFEPLATLAAIEKYGITHSQWVPTMFVRLLRLPEADRRKFDLSSHQVAIHAAAPCPVSVKEELIGWWGPIVHEYYGGSEGGGITVITPQEWLAHRGSVGRAAIAKIHIVGEDGREQPPGEPGVIYFEGGVPIEYHNDPEMTRRAYHERGWSTIGDVGYLDADGYLYLTDRKDFMIIVGGVNIYPQEAENVLITHPKVVDVAVFGVPNAEYGEEVKAVVQPANPHDAGPALAAELLDYVQARLARQKCPRTIDFEAELPRTPAGKLYKRRLRDKYWAGHTTRIV
jgi:acyl-CoA synthetase (AMP-forming)/AMP-acid ligase II